MRDLIEPGPAIIGMQGPRYSVDLERGRIRQIAKAIYAFGQDYHQDPQPVVPPTFLIMSGYFYGYILARAPNDSAFGSINEDFRTCAMATYAVNWLGAANIRRFKCRFDEMQFPGDEISYRGWVVRSYEEAGERRVDIELDFRRSDAVLGRAWASFVA